MEAREIVMTHFMSIARLLLAALIVGCTVVSTPAFGQKRKDDGGGMPNRECGTVLLPEFVSLMRQQRLSAAFHLGAAGSGMFQFVPVTLHVVRRGDGSGGISSSRLEQAMADANIAFSQAGIQFFRPGPVVFINSDAFFDNINSQSEIDALRGTNPVSGTMNIYFTENLATATTDLCGISSFTSSPVQGIVMRNDCAGVPSNPATVPHEIGHYFDLLHTHSTTAGSECVDGSNCSTAGDLICDTPADPKLSASNVDSDCSYTGSAVDSCNQDPYNPDTRNLMSYSRTTCMNRFTGQQNAQALATLLTLRPDHIFTSCSCSTVSFVDAQNSSTEDGSNWRPFNTVAEGVQNACPGGCVFIQSGIYSEAFTASTPMTLHAVRGPVVIGL
jgi:hypothetical protein